MIRMNGFFFARCNKCGRLKRIELDTSYMEMEYSYCERPMGTSFDYHFSIQCQCDCASFFSIEITGSEYPIGTVEFGKLDVLGAEITNPPKIEVEYEPDEYNAGMTYATPEPFDPQSIIMGMDDREFELFTGSVLYNMGYSDVIVTQRTRDGAYDFSAVNRSHGIENYVIGECKHYSCNHKVGEDVIRKLHDAQYQKHANTAMVVTSSSFTRDARIRATEYRMTLWDIDDLIQYGSYLLRNYT